MSNANTATAHKPTQEGAKPLAPATVTVTVDTVKTEIAGVEIALPVKFISGHVLSEAEAKALQAHYMRQFANNKNAAFKAWEEKAKAWDEAKKASKAEGERPVNPTASAALLSAWADYAPNVGAGGATNAEKIREEAGNRRFKEMVDEHNEALASGAAKSHFGSSPAKLPSGKGAADARAAIVAKILASEKQAAHVQRHIDAIIAEKAAEKDAPPQAKAVDKDAVYDF